MNTNSTADNMVLIWSEKLGVSYTLGGKRLDAVKSADLRIRRGEYVAVTGLFGPAKSSLLDVLGCLCKPSAGKYVFDYSDISLLEHEEIIRIRKNRIGFILPGLKLFNEYSIQYNLEYPLNYLNIKQEEKQALIGKAVEKADLSVPLDKKLGDLDEFHKHKVSLARAIVHEPLLLVACEPARGISPKETQIYMELLNNINSAGMTVVMVTDSEQLAQYAKRNIVFEDGLVSADIYSGDSDLEREVCAVCKD